MSRRAAALRSSLPGLAIAGVFAAVAAWVAAANGSVNDEYAAHITGGWLYLETGRFAGGVHNPPLGQVWVALLPWLSGQPLAPFTDAAPLLARLPNVLLGAAMLAMVFAFARSAAGVWPACAAALSLALCPEFLAHSALATLEAPMAFACLGAVLCLAAFIQEPSWPRAIGMGLFIGVGLAVKITGLVLVPIMLAVVAVLIVLPAGREHIRNGLANCGVSGRRAVLMILAAAAVAWLVLAVAYKFQGIGTVRVLEHTPAADARQALPLIVWEALDFVFPDGFVDATAGKFLYAAGGNETYMLGQRSTTGWWWYYPAGLALKTPIGLILLWLAALAFALRRQGAQALVFILPPVLLLTATMVGNRTQIGVRHLLPAVPLLALTVPLLARTYPRVVALLLLVAGADMARSLPWPLAYETALAGGRGYRLLADSNYDWGQANGQILAALDRDETLRRPRPFTPQAGRFVLRVNELNGFALDNPEAHAWLRGLPPVQRIAAAGLVFEVAEEMLGQLLDGRLPPFETAMGLATQKRWDEAEAHFERAIAESAEPGWIHYHRGLLREEQGDLTGAHRDLRRANVLLPGEVQPDLDYKAVGLLLLAERYKVTYPVRSEFEAANALLLRSDFAGAIKGFAAVLDKGAPVDATSLGLGQALALAERWEEAAEMLQRAAPSASLPAKAVIAYGNGQATLAQAMRVSGWAFARHAWGASASVLLDCLHREPDSPPGAMYLGQIVVNYKDWRIPPGNAQRKKLEALRF